MYERMVAAGQPPNTTTYNALISGEGQTASIKFDKIMRSYQVRAKLPRENSIT